MARNNCWTCRRPECVCLCDSVKKFAVPVNFILLAHPREARSKTSTGFLAHMSLEGSRYIEDYDFADNRDLIKIVGDVATETFLLFPTAVAAPVSSLRTQLTAPDRKPINVIVIEGTWSQSLCILARSPLLSSLPTLTLEHPRNSRFKFRTQPHAHCLSTIEAIAYCLYEMGDFSAKKTEAFLNPFLIMVERQIEFQKRNNPRYRRRWELVSEAVPAKILV